MDGSSFGVVGRLGVVVGEVVGEAGGCCSGGGVAGVSPAGLTTVARV